MPDLKYSPGTNLEPSWITIPEDSGMNELRELPAVMKHNQKFNQPSTNH